MGFEPQRKQTPRTQAEDLLSQLLTGAGGGGAVGQLATGNLPSFQGPFGVPLTSLQQSILGGVGGGAPDILSALRSLGTGAAGSLIPGAASSNLEALAGGAPLEDVFRQITSARQFGLGRDIGNIREQFSASGLRDTTDLARAFAARQAESEAGEQSLFGQLGLQNLAQRAQAAGTLGQLGLGEAGARLQALMGFPQVGRGLFDIGEAGRQVEEAPLLRMLQEFQRTQGSLLPLLLQFLSGTPQITGPGVGSQLLGAGATIAAGAAGAAG